MATGTIKNDLITIKTQITPSVTLISGNIYALKSGNSVTVYLSVRVSNGATSGSVLANIPSGLRPFSVIDVYSDQNGTQVPLRFDSDGNITVRAAINTSWLYAACSYVIE